MEGAVPPSRRLRIAVGELVVLFAIAAFLAAMVLPVFSRAADQARQAVCLANVKTVCLAIRMYLADNDGMFPPREHAPATLSYFNTRPGGGGRDQWDADKPGAPPNCHRASQANPYLRWPVVLDPYMRNREVWRCPSAVLQDGAWFINGAGANWLSHLKAHDGGWGRETQPWICPAPSWPSGWGGEVTDSLTQGRMAVPIGLKDQKIAPGTFLQSIGVNTAAGAEPSASAIPDHAWYVICADAGATIDDFCTGTLAYPDLCHLECAGPGDWEADWENCPWSRECGAIAAMKTNPELRKPYARHFGGVNIGFLDGHAQWWHSEKVIQESPTHSDAHRGRLQGYGPWGPTKDAYWYDPADGIPALY
jgi:prepilin-type processing-associated H-X9-DG protein